MKKLLILITFILFTVGCKKEKIFEFQNDFLAQFSFVDENGADLLNPSHPNTLNFDFMYLYKLENGEKKVIYNNHLANPKGMIIIHNSIYGKHNTLGIFNISKEMILDFGSNQSDTLTFDEYNGTITYNGEVVWDFEKDGSRVPIATIVK